MKQGLLIIMSGPSGAGKGTIYNEVLKRMPSVKKSVSVTTRAPRPHEKDGVDYYFKTLEEYQQMIAAGEFLETAAVYNNHYGTPKQHVFDLIKNGNDVMFEIDIHGARQIKKRYHRAISIYIMTPTFEILEERLRGRGTETEDSIVRRLGSAKSELAQYDLFDYIVFNDDIEQSVQSVMNIINAEKCKMKANEEKVKALLEMK